MSNANANNFIINIQHLPNSGLIIKDSISLEKLNARMNLAKDNDIIFHESPELDLQIKIQDPNQSDSLILINGSLKFSYQQNCGLCLDPQIIKQEKDCQLVLKRSTGSEEEEEDLELVLLDGPTFDLEDLIQEEIIVSISPYLLPERDANGKCLACDKTCGIEKKVETEPKNTLKVLLEKTLLKK